MGQRGGWLLVGLVLGAAVAGCAHSPAGCPCRPPPPHPFPELPVVERGSLTAAYQLPEPPASDAPAPGAYRLLTEQECQCLAVRASPVANLLDRERRAIDEQTNGGCFKPSRKKQEEARLREEVLLQSARELRNNSAGQALEVYFRLAEAEAKWDLLLASTREVGEALRRTRDLKDRGLMTPVDPELFARQQMELQGDQLTLQLNIDRLNTALLYQLDVPENSGPCRFWPAVTFPGLGLPVDCPAAVARALAQKPELILVRELRQRLNATTLPAARQMLQGVNALLGAAPKQPRCPPLAKLAQCFGAGGEEKELEARCDQLAQWQATRERSVADEVRLRVRALDAQSQVVALDRGRLESLREKVRELEDRNFRGLGGPGLYAEISVARLEWLKAQGKVVEDVTTWAVEWARLRQVEAALLLECEPCRCRRPCCQPKLSLEVE